MIVAVIIADCVEAVKLIMWSRYAQTTRDVLTTFFIISTLSEVIWF